MTTSPAIVATLSTGFGLSHGRWAGAIRYPVSTRVTRTWAQPSAVTPHRWRRVRASRYRTVGPGGRTVPVSSVDVRPYRRPACRRSRAAEARDVSGVRTPSIVGADVHEQGN